MYSRSLLVFILSLNLKSLFAQTNKYWEDPNDYFGESNSVYGKKIDDLNLNLKECRDELYYIREKNHCRGPRVIKEPCVAEHYLKRFLNILLGSSNFRDRKLGDGREMLVNLDLYFNSRTLGILQSFASSEFNEYSWADLDSTFLTLFEGDPTFEPNTYNLNRKSVNEKDEYPPPYTEPPESTLTPLCAIVGFFALFIIWLTLKEVSFAKSFYIAIIIILSLAFVWNYYTEVEHLKMEALLELHKNEGSEMPSSCSSPKWYNFMWGWNSEQCIKLLKVKNVSPMTAVDLQTVFKKTMMILFSWIPALADTISKSIDSYYGNSWMGSLFGLISRPLSFVAFIAFVVFIFLIYFCLNMNFRWKTFLWEVELNGSKPVQTANVGSLNSNVPNLTQNEQMRNIPQVEAPECSTLPDLWNRRASKTKRSSSTPRVTFSTKKALSTYILSSGMKSAKEDRQFRELRRTLSMTVPKKTD